MFNIALELKRVGAVLPDVFPKAPHEEIAWVRFTLGFDRFHVCGYIDVAINQGHPTSIFGKNICSEDDLRSRIFGTFFVKFLTSLPS